MSSVTQITVHCMPAILVYVNTHHIATLVGISCLILVNILEHNEVFVMSFLRSSIVVNVDYAVDKMFFFIYMIIIYVHKPLHVYVDVLCGSSTCMPLRYSGYTLHPIQQFTAAVYSCSVQVSCADLFTDEIAG